MMFQLLCLLTLVSSQTNIFDPRVYNYYFYVTTNSDIISANITTEQEAANHWQNIGVFAGQQAVGSFHVLQFLDNYPSLKQKYGTNYTAAINYYLEPNGGYDQGLYGYTIGGGYGRYTLGNISKSLYISGSLRMGSAIDSLVWNNTEFINNWGHGRQLQNSMTNHSSACWNPTEAGNYDDFQSNTSTSIILNISTSNPNKYESFSLPAFWGIPGQNMNASVNKGCGYAVNTVNVSNFRLNKSIKIMDNHKYNIFQYNISIYNPYNMSVLHLEVPCAYLTRPFNMFYGLNMSTGSLINYVISEGNNRKSPDPVIIATNDSNYALGVVTETPDFYALFNYLYSSPNTPDCKACTKWHVIRNFDNPVQNSWFHFVDYLCVGTLNDVKNCMIYVNTQVI